MYMYMHLSIYIYIYMFPIVQLQTCSGYISFPYSHIPPKEPIWGVTIGGRGSSKPLWQDVQLHFTLDLGITSRVTSLLQQIPNRGSSSPKSGGISGRYDRRVGQQMYNHAVTLSRSFGFDKGVYRTSPHELVASFDLDNSCM